MHDGDSDGWIPLKEMPSLLKDVGVSVTEDEMAKATGGDVNSSKLKSFSYIACIEFSLQSVFYRTQFCLSKLVYTLSKNRP